MIFRPNYLTQIIITTLCLLSLRFNLSYCILLQPPETLTQQEIENLEQENIKNGWGASFKGKQKAVTFYYHDDIVEIDFEFYEKIPDYIDEETKSKLIKTELSIDGKIVSTYILHIGTPSKQSQSQLEEFYCVNKPRNFKENPEENNPQNITVKKLANLIKTKNIIFYTGAGISAHAGIWTMDPLMDALGINFNCEFDQCMQNIITNLETIKTSFKEFCNAAFKTQATPAHNALTSIALLKQSQILTENFDLLHEHSGINPLHITGPWLKKNIDVNEFKNIDIVLCIGLSHDDRGFLGWYKTNNPNGVIVSINLNKQSYLGNEDFLLQGDCQEILPELGRKLSKTSSIINSSSCNPINKIKITKKLKSIAKRDQFLRKQIPLNWEKINKADKIHTKKLKKIISKFGWPTISLVGEECSNYAWLIVQYADHDIEFQKQCLELINSALENNDVDPLNFVYLYDRIQMNQNKPQYYGTQIITYSENGKEKTKPYQIEDAININERRNKFGMEPLDEYLKKF